MKLANQICSVEISNEAAQILHFRRRDNGLEYLWQGDPKYWSGRNPILFPIVGNTWSGKYRIGGKAYQLGNHGLARHAEFRKVSASRTAAVLEFASDSRTRLQYPFDFRLSVSYRLRGAELGSVYTIANTGDRPLPFSFGLHPAFNCPIGPGEKFSDYRIELGSAEALELYDWDSGCFVKGTKLVREIRLNRPALAKTIIIRSPQSPYVRLTNGKETVEVQTAGYPYLAFWSKPQAPFVCVEPWQGIGDLKPGNRPFAKRPGTLILEPGRQIIFSNYIRIS